MKNNLFKLIKFSSIPFFVFMIFINSCSDDGYYKSTSTETNDPYDNYINTDETSNIIIIKQTLPYTDLTNDADVTFSVIVEYLLYTEENAKLNIGFNTTHIELWDLIDDAETEIQKGHGYHTFVVNTRTKDWGDPGSFRVYVNISKEITQEAPLTLAFDSMKLFFKQDD